MTEKKFKAKVFFGPACSDRFVSDCCEHLGFNPKNSTFAIFADGESWLQLTANVREQEVFIVQPTPQPDKNWMILWQMIDAAKRASANKIIAILPYCGYLRQDRKDKPRVAITAKLALKTTETTGANRIVIMDPHFSQVQGFVEIPLDVLYGSKLFQEAIVDFSNYDTAIACDTGSTKISLSYVNKYNLKFGQAVKIRTQHNQIENMILALEESIDGKKVLLTDEMVDTGGSLLKLVDLVKQKGAKEIIVLITHGILSGEAIKNITASEIKKIYILDTVDVYSKKLTNKFVVIPSGKFFGEIIRRIHFQESLSSIFV